MIFSTSDPLDRSVTLKTNTWVDKITNTTGSNNNNEHGNSHKEMLPLLGEIKNTIEKPLLIQKDFEVVGIDDENNEIIKVSEKREEYYRVFVNYDKACLNGIKVIVEFDELHKNGEIVTTHLVNGKLSSNKIKGGVVYDANER